MSHDEIAAIVDRFGVTGTLLVAFIIGGWKIIRWLAPRADALIKKQFDLVDTLKESVASFKQTLEGILGTLKGLFDSIQSILSNQEEIRRDLGEIKDHVGLSKRKER